MELRQRGLSVEFEFPIEVSYKGVIVSEYKANLFVERSVVADLKIAKEYVVADEAQILNERNAGTSRIGLLIDFGKLKVEFKRFVF